MSRRPRIATQRSNNSCSSASTIISRARYELAINVWTRALFLDRSHARARAYIDRARSALAERQRESEELLQNGVAAFQRGDGEEASVGCSRPRSTAARRRKRRLRCWIASTAWSHAVSRRRRLPRIGRRVNDAARVADGSRSGRRPWHVRDPVAAGGDGYRPRHCRRVEFRRLAVDWLCSRRSPSPFGVRARAVVSPVPADAALPLPRRGETALLRRACAGRRRSPPRRLSTLDAVRSTDPAVGGREPAARRNSAAAARADSVPSGDASDQEKGERAQPSEVPEAAATALLRTRGPMPQLSAATSRSRRRILDLDFRYSVTAKPANRARGSPRSIDAASTWQPTWKGFRGWSRSRSDLRRAGPAARRRRGSVESRDQSGTPSRGSRRRRNCRCSRPPIPDDEPLITKASPPRPAPGGSPRGHLKSTGRERNRSSGTPNLDLGLEVADPSPTPVVLPAEPPADEIWDDDTASQRRRASARGGCSR